MNKDELVNKLICPQNLKFILESIADQMKKLKNFNDGISKLNLLTEQKESLVKTNKELIVKSEELSSVINGLLETC